MNYTKKSLFLTLAFTSPAYCLNQAQIDRLQKKLAHNIHHFSNDIADTLIETSLVLAQSKNPKELCAYIFREVYKTGKAHLTNDKYMLALFKRYGFDAKNELAAIRSIDNKATRQAISYCTIAPVQKVKEDLQRVDALLCSKLLTLKKFLARLTPREKALLKTWSNMSKKMLIHTTSLAGLYLSAAKTDMKAATNVAEYFKEKGLDSYSDMVNKIEQLDRDAICKREQLSHQEQQFFNQAIDAIKAVITADENAPILKTLQSQLP